MCGSFCYSQNNDAYLRVCFFFTFALRIINTYFRRYNGWSISCEQVISKDRQFCCHFLSIQRIQAMNVIKLVLRVCFMVKYEIAGDFFELKSSMNTHRFPVMPNRLFYHQLYRHKLQIT